MGNKVKQFLALTCEALARMAYSLAAVSNHTITIQLFRQGLHNRPKNLRAVLQEQIDAVPSMTYDAILLAYGMCGNSTVGLTARDTPLVIPRVHDCISLYLGSHEQYKAEFEQHPGTYWFSVDYMERQEKGAAVALGAAGIADQEDQYETYVAKFGKETADALMEEMRRWSQHYTRAVFIDTGCGHSEVYEQRAADKADREQWVFERRTGNNRLLKMLIEGDWVEHEILVVPPHCRIEQTGGGGLIRAVPA
ncbi:MAG: DUF1638 domain-containing protein [Chloroflexi bacterium]|nr:DUF1638 domain-containing protein [Chloroflexota bacterium]